MSGHPRHSYVRVRGINDVASMSECPWDAIGCGLVGIRGSHSMRQLRSNQKQSAATSSNRSNQQQPAATAATSSTQQQSAHLGQRPAALLSEAARAHEALDGVAVASERAGARREHRHSDLGEAREQLIVVGAPLEGGVCLRRERLRRPSRITRRVACRRQVPGEVAREIVGRSSEAMGEHGRLRKGSERRQVLGRQVAERLEAIDPLLLPRGAVGGVGGEVGWRARHRHHELRSEAIRSNQKRSEAIRSN